MNFFKNLFNDKKIEPVRIEHSRVYSQVVHLLSSDFYNWKLGWTGTRVHQPTGIGIACTGESAFIYVDCNDFNARSGRRVDLVYPENTELYKVLTVLLQVEESRQQLANRKKITRVLDDYLGEKR